MPEEAKIYTLSCAEALAIIADSPWGVATLDTAGKFQFLNDAYCTSLGCHNSSSLVCGTNIRDWIHADDLPEFNRLCDSVINGEAQKFIYRVQFSIRGPAGVFCWGILTVQGLWQNQNLSGFLVQFQPFSAPPSQPKWDLDRLKELVAWCLANKATVAMVLTTVTSVISLLTARNWQGVLDLLAPPPDVPLEP